MPLSAEAGVAAVDPQGRIDPDVFSRALAACDAVSFDVFDTVFIRLVADPEDVFDLVGHRHRLFDFRATRKRAQQEAFRVMLADGRREITLADIYACLPSAGAPAPDLMASEVEIEQAVLRPNPEILTLMAAARAAGKRVVLTSDMYLPSAMVVELCAGHGVDYDALFMSCERQATKRDHGALFTLVAEELALPPERILHVGDNPVSDVQRGREKGLQCLLYHPDQLDHAPRGPALYSSVVEGLARSQAFQTDRSLWWRYGFAFGAPATYAFLLWLDREARSLEVDRMLFLARDGFVLERLWRGRVGLEAGTPPRAPSAYLKATRTSLGLGAIDESTFESSLAFLLSGAEGLQLRDIFGRIGAPTPAEAVLADLGLSGETELSNETRALFIAVLQAFRGPIVAVCNDGRRGFHGYLTQLGLEDDSRVGVVDVGWTGTTQLALRDALSRYVDVELQGFYLCLQSSSVVEERRRTMPMEAMLSADNDPRAAEALYANRVALELFFSAPHGSVIGYRSGGRAFETVEDPGRDADPRLAEVASEINAGIEAGVAALDRVTRELHLEPHAPSLLAPIVRFVANPTVREAKLFGSLHNFDAWGASSAFRRWVARAGHSDDREESAWPAGVAALSRD